MNVLVIAGSGIGGTEKAAFLYAEALVRRGYRVIALSEPGQARGSSFVNAGGLIHSGSHTVSSFLELIEKYQIQVIHQHVSGYGDHRELYSALDRLGINRPKLIETNVFGLLLDFHECNHVDMRMFISLTSGVQAFRRTRMFVKPDIKRNTVLYYPRDPNEGGKKMGGDQFRAALGISPTEFVALRVGRPGHKWTKWECQAYRLARQQNPNVRLILMEPTSAITSEIEKGRFGDGIIVLAATSDFEFLNQLYQAADLMIHASSFGESFGYTLAEAMVASLPIITRATPWGDNAQTELVHHGTTGYVCGSVEGMAMALLELSKDRKKCAQMGKAAKLRVDSVFQLDREIDLLEEILRYVMGGDLGILMKGRYLIWQQYDRKEYQIATHKRYESDQKLILARIFGKIYDTIRCVKTLKRYFRQRAKGRPVFFPSLRF